MKKARIFIALLLVLPLSGCVLAKRNTPPTVETVETWFQENRADFLTIVDYCRRSEYELLIISLYEVYGDTSLDDVLDDVFADFDSITIEDREVRSAIERLFSKGICLGIYKEGKVIEFLLWTGFIRDIGCGLLYISIPNHKPSTQYMTERQPLSEDGWFYYIDDYNEWRARNP